MRIATLPASLLAPALVLALPLAGCSNGGRPYPSLERRPSERVFGSAVPVGGPNPAAAPVAAPPTAGLDDRLAALRAQALAADRQFQSRQGAASRAVAAASGAAVGSESWSVAQVTLADLDSARSQAMIALADLDSLLVSAAQANVDAPTPDLPAIEKVRGEVTALIAGEDDVLAALRGRLQS